MPGVPGHVVGKCAATFGGLGHQSVKNRIAQLPKKKDYKSLDGGQCVDTNASIMFANIVAIKMNDDSAPFGRLYHSESNVRQEVFVCIEIGKMHHDKRYQLKLNVGLYDDQ